MGTPSFDGSIQVSIHALPYDSQAAADAIFARPQLVRGYADSLMSGVWPSHDILPVDEQMATGQPLSESTLHWPAASKAVKSRWPLELSPVSVGIAVGVTLGLAIAMSW